MKIGDIAEITGCSIQTIRFYERKKLLPEPTRTDANYRLYDQNAIERLTFIKQCRAHDMSIQEISLLLANKEMPEESCDSVNAIIDEHLQQITVKIEELIALKKSLKQMVNSCSSNRKIKDCGILSNLTKLD
ncbi:Cd(II)/Pb(II)-responsive transcriptional regulator [Catenovulum maritimum]|uniref:MerR family transcriptional regulator n=1 Tax=Catenovulum maritimum TaxID=1513271 RepID=A0A0J8GZU9_9ALTE|nr:Cd(II)/Pb(II)-responsive transcriptional regulator [Catenovulum maritimum]KMT66759.1 MerR family transcriptional regulator [Catenovulum maritimum]